jgi:hypothetical protein
MALAYREQQLEEVSLRDMFDTHLGNEAVAFLDQLEEAGAAGSFTEETESDPFDGMVLNFRLFDRRVRLICACLESEPGYMEISFGDWNIYAANVEKTGRTMADMGIIVYKDKGYSQYINSDDYNPETFEYTPDGLIDATTVVMNSPHTDIFYNTLVELMGKINPYTVIVFRPNTEQKYKIYKRIIQRSGVVSARDQRAVEQGMPKSSPFALINLDNELEYYPALKRTTAEV